MERVESRLIKILKKNRITVAFAESVTCGLAAHQLSTVKGTNEVFKGSIVCYMPEVKKSLMRVSEGKICKYTCESKEVTEALVINLPKLIKADLHAAITGLASSGGSETPKKPVGTIFFSIYFKRKKFNYRKKFNGSPLEIRKKACHYLFSKIMELVK